MKRCWKYLQVMPIILVLTLIPLISIAKKYEIGLSGFTWFSNSVTSVDIFLYWKGRGLIALAFLMFIFMIIRLVLFRKYKSNIATKIGCPELACVAIYFVCVLLSSIFSKYQIFSFFGSYEQWEGFDVITAYLVVLLYTYLIANRERVVRVIIYSILVGSFFMGLIGTFQFLQMDIFRTDLGQTILNLLSDVKMTYSFNFSLGWVYATLYNPNYVGSYAALVLPIVITLAMIEWKKIPRFFTVLAMVTTCLLTITLLGSESMTGCIGVAASAIAFCIYFMIHFIRRYGIGKIVVTIVGVGVFAGAMTFLFPEEIGTAVGKVFSPKEDYHVIQKMLSTQHGLQVTTVNDDVFYVKLTGERETPFIVTGMDDKEIILEEDSENNYYTLKDNRFNNIRLYNRTITADLQSYHAVRIFNPTINKEWTIAKVNETYMVYNAFSKLDTLKEIPAFGFEKNQHFGDKRGYIWSRTFPLLKNYIFLGSGPNTFTEIFPNDDYIGKTNMNYNGVTVTKPHNMYLQIWVQTGLLSLLAFLALVLLYLGKSVKLYWNRKQYTILNKFGVALMFSIFGYMVTGIANDSTVAVAPIFWIMLGLGFSVNFLSKRIDTLG